MKYVVSCGERLVEVEVLADSDGGVELRIDGDLVRADMVEAGGSSLYSLLLDHEAFDLAVVEKDGCMQVTVNSRLLELVVESEQERNARLVAGDASQPRAHTIKSQMPGVVTRILVREGEEVRAGSALVILEAMKMENEVRALHAGVVQRILVSEGQTVNGGDELVRLG